MRTLICVLLLVGSGWASQDPLYVASASAGADNGTSCANAHSAAFFNNAANWGAGAAQIGAGTVVHLCGAFASQLTVQGDGAASNPVIIRFEAGATYTVAALPSTGAITGGARQWITIDGNSVGVISSTANGSPGAFANSLDSGGIFFSSCSNCEIKGFNGSGHIGPIYRHTSPADNNSFGDAVDIHGGSNVHIHDIAVSDASHCTTFNLTGTQTNLEIDHIVGHNCNWITVVGSAGNVTFSNFLWHDNEGYDWQNWDTTAGSCCHHNGLHLFLEGGTGISTITGFQGYNDYCHGDAGVNSTACFFLEANSGTIVSPLIFNNIYWMSTHAFANGAINTKGAVTNPSEYDNLWGYPVNLGGNCVLTQGGTNVMMNNNIFYNCGQAFFQSSGTLGTSDYNDFFGTTKFGPGATQNPTFAGWKSSTGGDSHSVTTDPKLDSNFIPQSGSGATGTGVNLFSTCNGQPLPGLGALCLDKNGVARSSSAAWDIGAFASGSVPPPPPSTPTGLTVSIQ